MIVRNGKTYHYAPINVTIDEEAHKKVDYGKQQPFNAYIYPASGQVQAETYGNELKYILNLLTNEDVLKEGYGVAYNSTEINYKVISIKEYTGHFLCELKKL